MDRIKKNIRYLMLILIMSILATNITYAEETFDIEYHRAKVIGATSLMKPLDNQGEAVQYVTLKITSGKYKNQVFESKNIISGRFIYDFPVNDGDNVIVIIDSSDDSIQVHIADYRRDNYIAILIFLFFGLLIIIGRMKGVKTIVTLSITVFMIFKFMIPLLLKGHSPAMLAIIISIVATIITLTTIGGISTKSLSAIIGTTIGVLVAGLLAYIIGSMVRLTGLSGEEAIMLMYIKDDITINFKELLFAGILLGALGAVMDVSISIASSIEEVYRANTDVDFKTLFNSGMNVGRDIMGTMANTLILAYAGSSIPLLMVFMSTNASFTKVMNFDIIATEIVRALSGSIGLIITIPSTALVSCFLIYKSREKEKCKIKEN